MNAKLRWIVSTVLACSAGLFLLNASSPPNKADRTSAEQAQAAPAERAGTYVANVGFTFSTPIQLVRPPSSLFFEQAGEPEIKVDIFGNIYATAMRGVPGGVDLWKSVDNGGSFTFLGQPDGAQDHCPTLPECFGLGGGDDQIDVSPGGYLYVSSLWLGNITMSTSYDGGMGGVLPGQKWEVQPAAAGITPDDRQWVAAYGPETINMTWKTTAVTNPPGGIGLFFNKSTDAGKTFSVPVNITPAAPLNSVNVAGNLVVDPYNGNLYTSFIPNAAANQIHLAKSTNGGSTWTITTAYTGPAGTSNRAVFPILAVDRGGNLHLVFSRITNATRACHVFLTSTANPGAPSPTWLPAVQVDSGSGPTTTSVEPWVIAGSPGVVNIVWLGSSASTPDFVPNPPPGVSPTWHVFFSQTTNALSGSPLFNQVQVTATPIHNRSICFNGLACTGEPSGEPQNRDLLEYSPTLALDPDGNANIIYSDSVNNCPEATCIAKAWFTKQTAGTKAYAPLAPPAPATFAPNIPVGAPGSEPGIWVDSFNCIYVTAPGNPWVWKSVNNGASFLPPVNPVADEPTLTGGDEDIISLPKQDGSQTRPDQLYFTDLGLSTCHIRKSTDGNATWFKPGPGGAAGDVSVSSDRQWLAGDQGFPAAGDQIIYHWEHELVSETMRFSSLVNDTAWQFTTGMTDPELAADPVSNTYPNTNPGPIFVNKTTHRVFALFNGSVLVPNNLTDPPFGKLLNVWEADAAPPPNAAVPVTDVQNHPVFKGVYDSPNNDPPAVAPPSGPTFGTNNANIFPAGDIDSAGNIYVAWSMNNSRTNEFSIWFASSHDNGQTYYGPFWVSSGPMTADETAVFPWLAAGDNGRVDIIWYQTSAVGDPNTIAGNPPWRLYFAQSLNANSREPVFRVVQPNPANIIHNGQISTGGLLGSSDRSLLDFMEVAIGPDGLAHAIFADNGGQPTRAEYTKQIGGPRAKTNPTSPVCQPIIPVSAVSRKTHGAAGAFDVNLPLTGPSGIECRTGGASGIHQMVVTFAVPVTVLHASVSSGTGSVGSVTTAGNQVFVNLTAVSDVQTIVVTLTIDDGPNIGTASIPMGVLAGDTNADRRVNVGDTNETRSRSGQVLNPASQGSGIFRNDVNLDARINVGDTNFVRSRSGGSIGP
jgi:hypothetical protein